MCEGQDGLRLLGAAPDAPPDRTQQLLAALAAGVVQLVREAGCEIAHLRAEVPHEGEGGQKGAHLSLVGLTEGVIDLGVHCVAGGPRVVVAGDPTQGALPLLWIVLLVVAARQGVSLEEVAEDNSPTAAARRPAIV